MRVADGPDAMLTEGWDVHRRRAHLKDKLGFVCGCARCKAEAAAEAAGEAAPTVAACKASSDAATPAGEGAIPSPSPL